MCVGVEVSVGQSDGVQEDRTDRRVPSPAVKVDTMGFDRIVDGLVAAKRPPPFAVNEVLPVSSPTHREQGSWQPLSGLVESRHQCGTIWSAAPSLAS